MIGIDPQDIPFSILFVFAVLHLLYFMVYYGRYSRLNQKLVKLVRMEKVKVVPQASIDLTRNNTNYRIWRIRRICYLPNGIILLLHWIFNGVYFGKQLELGHFLESLGVALAGMLLILMGNYTKGAQIIDPKRQFHKVGRF